MTWLHLFLDSAAADPDRVALVTEIGGTVETITRGELADRGLRVAGALSDLEPGSRVALLIGPGSAFFAAFIGCLAARVIAVPLAIPRTPSHLKTAAGILADAAPSALIVADDLAASVDAVAGAVPELARLPRLLVSEVVAAEPAPASLPEPDDVAFLQYTSGSTSAPRGVAIQNRNLLANIELMVDVLDMRPGDVTCTWLPHFHDMGLMSTLEVLARGARAVLLSPLDFLRRPAVWIEAMARHGATHTAGPNFGYDLVVRRTTAAERAAVDLSLLRTAVCGAEPVRADTFRRFVAAFSASGLREECFVPSYGMAEVTLFAAGVRTGAGPRVLEVDAAALEAGSAREPDGAVRRLVAHPLAGDRLRVCVVRDGEVVPDGTVGEIWLAGASVCAGYWGRPADHGFAHRDGTRWFRSGDLGFVRDGALYVTGRSKDLVIVAGRNLYPQDLELTLERCHPAVRPGHVAVFAVDDGEQEGVGVVAELRSRVDAEPREVAAAIRAALSVQHAVRPAHLALVPQGTTPRTTSGKIQRAYTRTLLERGRLPVVLEAVRNAPVVGRRWDRASLEDELVALIADQLAIDEDEIELDLPLSSYGVDSLLAAELAATVEARFGIPVDATVFWEVRDVEGLARRLEQSLG